MVVTRDITHNKEVILKVTMLLSSLNIKFKIIDNYIRSFVHRSIVNERPDFAPEHNERLEFL
jgi:dsRNA-specific ribonuclease